MCLYRIIYFNTGVIFYIFYKELEISLFIFSFLWLSSHLSLINFMVYNQINFPKFMDRGAGGL